MRICVFCGSRPGTSEKYRDGARALGELLADEGIGLVYGGASVGLMGIVANAVHERGGEVIGVIPRGLMARELALPDLEDLRVVGSMHERKALMAELSDAFVALPGGIGTLEELFEVWTWSQLGIHRKACCLLDIDGFYRPLMGFVDHVVEEGFLGAAQRDTLIVESEGAMLLSRIRAYRPPPAPPWMTPKQI